MRTLLRCSSIFLYRSIEVSGLARLRIALLPNYPPWLPDPALRTFSSFSGVDSLSDYPLRPLSLHMERNLWFRDSPTGPGRGSVITRVGPAPVRCSGAAASEQQMSMPCPEPAQAIDSTRTRGIRGAVWIAVLRVSSVAGRRSTTGVA